VDTNSVSPTLTTEFIRNIRAAFGSQGQAWLASLPELLEAACHRWELTPGEPFLLSYNYVLAVTRTDGSQAVLKLGFPNPELTSEINTLRLVDGQGACRILDSDPGQGLLLLERLQPGVMLATMEEDDIATRIAASLMRQFWRSPPQEPGFLDLGKWFDELKELRPHFSGSTGTFPRKTVEKVDSLLPGLLAESSRQVLLHGDLHHYNILSSGRGWLAIDPKGVVGPAEFEPGPLLMNPIGIPISPSEGLQRLKRRVDILVEELGFDRQRLLAWALSFGLLSAWWDIKDGSGGPHAGLAFLAMISDIAG
jgi:streptomycin 6-kinase